MASISSNPRNCHIKSISEIYRDIPVDDFKNVYYVLVEGNISSGKSTVCNWLVSYLKNTTGYEVVHIAEKLNFPLLNKYLKNPKESALCFQLYMATWRIAALREYLRYGQEKPLIVIVDRSIYGDIIFGKTNHIFGNIDDESFNLYLNTIVEDCILPKNRHVIYLKAELEVCFERICKRDRLDEKSDYNMGYLSTINKLHDEAFSEMENVSTLDWNKDFSEDEITRVFSDIMGRFGL